MEINAQKFYERYVSHTRAVYGVRDRSGMQGK